jgi:hypothetical protein
LPPSARIDTPPALSVGSPLPASITDGTGAHPAHICTGTGAHPCHICPGTGAHRPARPVRRYIELRCSRCGVHTGDLCRAGDACEKCSRAVPRRLPLASGVHRVALQHVVLRCSGLYAVAAGCTPLQHAVT